MASMPPPQTHLDYPFLYQDFPPPPAQEAPSSDGGCISGGHRALTSWGSDQFESYPITFFDGNVPMVSERHDNMTMPPDLLMHGLSVGFQGFGTDQLVDDYCFTNEYSFNSTSPSSEDNHNWRYQCGKASSSVEESNIKVGRYSAEEKKDRILRYLKKRNQRNFNKTIKYACRKTLADRRVRVRGRFARNNELLSEEETITKKNVNGVPNHKESEFFSGEALKLKHDDEDWLQEAMASLLYLPCMSNI